MFDHKKRSYGTNTQASTGMIILIAALPFHQLMTMTVGTHRTYAGAGLPNHSDPPAIPPGRLSWSTLERQLHRRCGKDAPVLHGRQGCRRSDYLVVRPHWCVFLSTDELTPEFLMQYPSVCRAHDGAVLCGFATSPRPCDRPQPSTRERHILCSDAEASSTD
jgi:hypothetical protein